MNSISNIPSYIREFTDFQFYISPDPQENERVRSFNITSSKPHEHVIINSERVSGQYKGIFELGENQIKTVNRESKNINNWNRFEDVPKNNEQDCFYFKPPSSLDYPIDFTIQITYDQKQQSSSSSSSSDSSSQNTEIWIENLSYSKTYRTIVKGTWDIWSKSFKNYLREFKQ